MKKTYRINFMETTNNKTERAAELLPCAFCGEPAEWINKVLFDGRYYIRCSNGECHVIIKADRQDKAIGFWNRRLVREPEKVKEPSEVVNNGEGWPAINAEKHLQELIKKNRESILVIEGKSQFSWGFRECMMFFCKRMKEFGHTDKWFGPRAVGEPLVKGDETPTQEYMESECRKTSYLCGCTTKCEYFPKKPISLPVDTDTKTKE